MSEPPDLAELRRHGDPSGYQLADANAVFAHAKNRNIWWVTGTEANQASDSVNFRKGAAAAVPDPQPTDEA